MVRPGYAVEYDYVDPRALTPSLEVRALPGLFLAGQIDTARPATSLAAGAVAGIDAARRRAVGTAVELVGGGLSARRSSTT